MPPAAASGLTWPIESPDDPPENLPSVTRERRFHHPELGPTTYEHHRLLPSDSPGLHVVIYSPAPDPVL